MSLEQQIEAALRRLPVADDDRDRVERAIEYSGWSLRLRMGVSNLTSLNTVNPSTRRQAAKQLRGFADALDGLDRAMSDLSSTAAEELDQARENLGIEWVLSLPQGIRALIAEHYPGAARAARFAAEELEANPGPSERGKREDKTARALAEAVGEKFLLRIGRQIIERQHSY